MKRLTEQNHYTLLDISPKASFEEVRSAYDKAMSVYSADSIATYSLLTREERERMLSRLADAYKTLTDSQLRKEYNSFLIEKGELSPQEIGLSSLGDSDIAKGKLREVSVESLIQMEERTEDENQPSDGEKTEPGLEVEIEKDSIKELLGEVIDQIFNVLEAIDRGAILLINKETGRLKEVVSKTRMEDKEGLFSKINYSRTILSRTIRKGEPVMMSDTSRVDKVELSDSMEVMNVRSVMCVPLKYKEEVQGVIYVDSIRSPEGFRKDDLQFLAGLGNTAAIATENVRLYSDLENLVEHRTRQLERSKDELKESQSRFRAVFENMSSGVAIFEEIANGEDFIFKDLNKAAEKIDKIKKEDVVGKSVLTVFPSFKDYGLFDILRRVWKTGKPEDHPPMQYKDDRISSWRKNYLHRLPKGEIVFIYEDVTAQKQAIENQERLQRQLSYAQKTESLGRAAGGVDHSFRDILQAIMGNSQFLGKDYFFEINAHPSSHGLSVFVKDITEQKQGQEAPRENVERYRLLFEQSPIGIGLASLGGEVISINKAMQAITGYSLEELKKINLADTYEKPEHRKALLEAVNRYGGVVDYPVRLKRKDGTLYDALLTISRVHHGDEDLFQTICVDVSKRKRAEEEREKLQARLQEAQKTEAIATLAGGIAHEFNNTLVGISGNIDLLQMDLPDDKNVSKYAERMRASALHMAHLTDQLLAYARGGKYQPKTISLTEFVEETLPLIKQTIAPSIRLETDLLHGILNVEADLTQMQMVLSAILNNSAEAIEEKGRIRITTRDEEIDEEFAKNHPGLKPGPYVSLTVEDDGKGMDEETRAKIFDPFFTTKFQGRGLGMAAVYGIVTNHGGCISVDSELGKGTVVRIYLPAVKVEVKEEERPRIKPSKGTILVIEDEDVVIDVICAMLERLGYRVLLAKSGKEAVNIAKTFDGDIDLAILDILLPDLAGKEAYREIMKARPNLKVIVCSGYTIHGPPQEILDAGAQDFIQKPFSYATLSEKLKEVLEGK